MRMQQLSAYRTSAIECVCLCVRAHNRQSVFAAATTIKAGCLWSTKMVTPRCVRHLKTNDGRWAIRLCVVRRSTLGLPLAAHSDKKLYTNTHTHTHAIANECGRLWAWVRICLHIFNLLLVLRSRSFKMFNCINIVQFFLHGIVQFMIHTHTHTPKHTGRDNMMCARGCWRDPLA